MWTMSDSEVRSLRRAVAVLLLLSLVRWSTAREGPTPQHLGPDPLPELLSSADSALLEAEQRSRPLSEGERLDPNRASAVQLDRLPGVGAVTAGAIVRTRETSGPFSSPADLERVPGIGPTLAGRLAPLVDLDDPPPGARRPRRGPPDRLDLNTAGPEALSELPGIGPSLADRIVAFRSTRRFTSPDQLLEVRGIGPATLERIRPLVRAGPGR